ncbi:G-type lectin S-receptor-like serine/threonine-protein kinase At1g11330 [Quercus robur]|uniref:G-type lectin S-receptor-like serine/threonine-protein kinase At1g11330 n=1 Tax=Quercus robur TaxID=38942 RepID=UPI00216351A8|nr:G-type lectin S-receptor-like serine/threonine-protein kinase At1g11330 [Quercus robur]
MTQAVWILNFFSQLFDLGIGTKKWICVAIFTAIAVLVIVFCILCYLLKRRAVVNQGSDETNGENGLLALLSLDSSINMNEILNDWNDGARFSVISYTCVIAATNNFSLENKLGEGGFGPVYKGKLAGGKTIAIKRLGQNSEQGILEFKTELIVMPKLHHVNIVKLIGCCIHGEERMLVYEYMPNKSLDCFLFDSKRSKLLDWKNRFNIIEGIAQGLLYLHKYSRQRIIHRDLKASNILLDQNMNPKISDFGMARIFKPDELEANTNVIVGTYGYMSPEYAMEGVFSIKSDVYSFGVLMLEIVSGRKNNSFYHVDYTLNLVGNAWNLWEEGQGLELIDPSISDSCVKYKVLRWIHIGLLCIQNNTDDRPTISDVLFMLRDDSTPLPLPKNQPYFFG